MIEIVCRGKEKKSDTWRYGAVITYPDGETQIIRVCGNRPDERHTYEVKADTVGRYTGLTDGDNKKVFEGDILFDGVHYGVVKFGEYTSNFSECNIGFYVSWMQEPHYRKDIVFWCNYEYAKVVGNIFDNPELLKKVGD